MVLLSCRYLKWFISDHLNQKFWSHYENWMSCGHFPAIHLFNAAKNEDIELGSFFHHPIFYSTNRFCDKTKRTTIKKALAMDILMGSFAVKVSKPARMSPGPLIGWGGYTFTGSLAVKVSESVRISPFWPIRVLEICFIHKYIHTDRHTQWHSNSKKRVVLTKNFKCLGLWQYFLVPVGDPTPTHNKRKTCE